MTRKALVSVHARIITRHCAWRKLRPGYSPFFVENIIVLESKPKEENPPSSEPQKPVIDFGLSGGILAEDLDQKKKTRRRKKKSATTDDVPIVGIMNAPVAPLPPVSVGLFTGVTLTHDEKPSILLPEEDIDKITDVEALRSRIKIAENRIVDLLKENEELRRNADGMRREIRGLEVWYLFLPAFVA